MTPSKPSNCSLSLSVNGVQRELHLPAETSLLHLLRNDLELNSPKYGCGLGECGACTVLVDGMAARVCVIPAAGVAGREITTLEGLGSLGLLGNLHPVQQAFIDEQAAQCGYCLSGMIMMTASLLARTPNPDDLQIRQALSGNLCRCGAHLEIIKAVHRAAELMAQARVKAPEHTP
jgi:nicotinate dehydrogenase subunit A